MKWSFFISENNLFTFILCIKYLSISEENTCLKGIFNCNRAQ